MGEVVELNVITTLPIDPKRILAKACDVSFDRVMIIGVTADGDEYFASSEADGGTCLWDMERARHAFMRIADDASDH